MLFTYTILIAILCGIVYEFCAYDCSHLFHSILNVGYDISGGGFGGGGKEERETSVTSQFWLQI